MKFEVNVISDNKFDCAFSPMAHLFGHTRGQTAEVSVKHGVLFSNGSQYGHETSTTGGRPVVIDFYLPPDIPAKTNIYKLPTWKEENRQNTEDSNKATGHWPNKVSCSMQ